MQLTRIYGKLKPITITASMAIAGAGAIFSYSDIDKFVDAGNIITNVETMKYLRAYSSIDGVDLYDAMRYEQFKEAWKQNTMFISSAQAIIEDANFQGIVAMGDRAVPYIIRDINESPSTLVWALNMIFKKKITNKANTSIEEACKLWVRSFQSN